MSSELLTVTGGDDPCASIAAEQAMVSRKTWRTTLLIRLPRLSLLDRRTRNPLLPAHPTAAAAVGPL